MDANVLRRLGQAVEAMPQGLRDHVRRVDDEALRLADAHGVDRERARIAALGHDLARAANPSDLLALASLYGIDPDNVERAAPILLHGAIGAAILAKHYHVDDTEVLDAARWHTTARPGMSVLEKVLFLADKVEEDKVRRRPAWAEVRELAAIDLNAALLRFLDLQIEYALEKRWQIHPRTVLARNELLPQSSDGG